MTKIVAEKIIVLANSADSKIHWRCIGRDDRQGAQRHGTIGALFGVKRTLIGRALTSAFDPKRTFVTPSCCDAQPR